MYFKFMNLNVFELFTTKLARDDSNEETTVDGSDGSTKQTRGSFPAGMCKECPPNSIINERKTGCTQCPDGNEPNTDKTACVPCPKGKAGTDGTCEPCINNQTYQNETGQITCKECSKCNAHHYVSTLCSQSSDTICSRCNRKFTRDGIREVDWNENTKCKDNCKVQFSYDISMDDHIDDVDVAGLISEGQDRSKTFTHYKKENILDPDRKIFSSGPQIVETSSNPDKNIRTLTYQFWHNLDRNNSWKFNIMTNPRKYNPPNNYLTTCKKCNPNERPDWDGSGCLIYYSPLQRLKSNEVW